MSHIITFQMLSKTNKCDISFVILHECCPINELYSHAEQKLCIKRTSSHGHVLWTLSVPTGRQNVLTLISITEMFCRFHGIRTTYSQIYRDLIFACGKRRNLNLTVYGPLGCCKEMRPVDKLSRLRIDTCYVTGVSCLHQRHIFAQSFSDRLVHISRHYQFKSNQSVRVETTSMEYGNTK